MEKKVSGTVVSTITTERTYDDLNRVEIKKETSVEGGVTTVIGLVLLYYRVLLILLKLFDYIFFQFLQCY